MIKPPRPDRHVAFCRHPLCAGTVASIQATLISSTWSEVFCVERGPTGLAGNAAFVAHPADVRSGIAEQASIRLKITNHLPGRGPIIVGFAIDAPRFARLAVKTIAAVRAVEKDFEDGTIVRQQFPQLIA